MVIDARRIFTCSHSFVSVKEGGLLLFVCAECEYRTELLPLRPSRATQPDVDHMADVESFAAARAVRY